MTFRSILFLTEEARQAAENSTTAQDFFVDLNLNQIIDSITIGRQEYDLKPFFHTLLHDIATIRYRQDIMRELENPIVFEAIKSFAQKMRVMHRQFALSGKIDNQYHKEGWFLAAAEIYCDAVNCLLRELTLAKLQSTGFLAFREYMAKYAESEAFSSLLAETKQRADELASVKYCLLIKDDCIKVRKYEAEIDYSAAVEETFEKFKQGAVKDYRAKLSAGGMNHVEAAVLDMVGKLFPDIFGALDNYCERYRDCLDETILIFEREIQFYIAYLEYAARFKKVGLQFCYPEILDQCKSVCNYDGFDLALANQLITQNLNVVCNDFYLKDAERIIVVSGPNQGGKTTFARVFGQLHYLAGIGCPVPGREARLFLFDRLLTHFEKEETISSLSGKLQDDLLRIHAVLSQATPDSIVIMNEIFTSTTLKDAIFLSKKILEKILDLDLLCVCVTFIDELSILSGKTVSMVSTVVPENPALRTYKIVRRPADGVAYAVSIAEKHRLTYDLLKERIKS